MIYLFFFIHLFISPVFAADATPSATTVPVSHTPTPIVKVSPTQNLLPTSIASSTPLLKPSLSLEATKSATIMAIRITKITTVSAQLHLTVTPTTVPTPTRMPLLKVIKKMILPALNLPESFLHYARKENFYPSMGFSPFVTLLLLILSVIFFVTGLFLLFWDKIRSILA